MLSEQQQQETQPLNQNKEEEQHFLPDQVKFGPLQERSCTDILCFLVFLITCIIMFSVALYGWKNGHPDRLMQAYDSDGRPCGHTKETKDYPYIYLGFPLPGYYGYSACVKSCPSWTTTPPSSIDCVTNSRIKDCTGHFLTSLKSIDIKPELAIYKTKAYFGRICLPIDLNFIKENEISNLIKAQDLEKYFADIRTAWGIIFASAGISLLVGLVYMIVMRYMSGCMTWSAIILYFAGLVALGLFAMQKGKEFKDEAETDQDPDSKEINENNGRNLYIVSYIIWGLLGVSLIIIGCMFNRIRLAIAIIKSAALFMGQVPQTIAIPPVIGFLQFMWMACWFTVFVFVYSVGEITGSKTSPFATIKWDKSTRNILWFHLFGGLWVNALLLAINQFIIASTVCIWYFSQPSAPHAPILRSIYRTFRYHLGSLAFGALILAVVQFIKGVLAYMSAKAKASGASQNQCVKCVLKCMLCLVSCFERFIKFLTRNAYIQIALTGHSFCEACKDAFYLVLRNPAKFTLVSGIGQVFIFVGKLFISCFTTFICYQILAQAKYYKEHLFSPLLPSVACFIVSYLVGYLFMSVYGMSIDTILQCSCADEELMKKEQKPPQHTPGPLQQYFEATIGKKDK